MRRRRKLQVDTSPFLAVLLCAMGSLILILLIMDRRARMAARARGAAAAALAREEALRHAASRHAARELEERAARAAWEARRQALHQQLSAQHQKLLAEVARIRQRLSLTAARSLAEEQQLALLRESLAAQRRRVDRAEDTLSRRRGQAEELGKESEATRQALAQMRDELARLEKVLRHLQVAREERKEAFSVVPYRGKYGDDRRPHYVECAGKGVTFHPEAVFHPRPLDPGKLRAEVQARIARRSAAGDDDVPYLLLLIRPDGIHTYYDLQEALVGLTVDFGYELIDQEWALHFDPEPDTVVRKDRGGPAAAAGPFLPGIPGSPALPLPGNGPGKGTAFGGPLPGPGTGAGLSGPLPGLGRPRGMAGGPPGPGGSGIMPLPGVPLASRGGAGSPPGQAGVHTSPGGAGGKPGLPAGSPATAGTGLAPPGITGAPMPQGPGRQAPPSSPPATGQTPTAVPGDRERAPGTAPKDTGARKTPDDPGEGAGEAPPGEPGDDGRGGTPGTGGPGAEDQVGEPAPQLVPPPRLPGKPRPRPRPRTLRPAHLGTDRPSFLFVECRADEVILYPAGTRIDLNTLGRPGGADPLLAAARALLKHAVIPTPPGKEPNTQIRFLVRPDGLRGFHMAYPLLDGIPLPKMRQSLGADTDVITLIRSLQ